MGCLEFGDECLGLVQLRQRLRQFLLAPYERVAQRGDLGLPVRCVPAGFRRALQLLDEPLV